MSHFAPKEQKLTVPADKAVRDTLWAVAEEYVASHHLVPPLSLEELQEHTSKLIAEKALVSDWQEYLMILLSNFVWRDTISGVPYERRVLLLPQCLRHSKECKADMDEFGLLCEQCGLCRIGQLQDEAESLGYVVLVAEGTTVVTKLIDQGKIDAVVGVSCLDVLERAFPHMAMNAIPGFAVPLHVAGCVDTQVDLDRIRNALYMRSDEAFLEPLDLEVLRSEVDYWFERPLLDQLMGAGNSRMESISRQWLAKSGKRWRPLLAVAAGKALRNWGNDRPVSDADKQVAIAVECFHKASLIHDDIEDDDPVRYGEKTLHEEYGVPIALNVGDLLLGDGYRLIAESDFSPAQKVRMLTIASEGHRSLCLGQGQELLWMHDPRPLTAREVLDIFRYKTGPAFEVALRLGAVCVGVDADLEGPLKQFSEALGIAYQIRDDLDDFTGDDGSSDAEALRPSILLAVAYESADGAEREFIEELWLRGCRIGQDRSRLEQLIASNKVQEKVKLLLEHHKNEAIRSLRPVCNSNLKSLLHRIVGRIFRED